MAKKSHLSAPKWVKWLQEWQANRNDEENVAQAVIDAINGTDVFNVSLESHFLAPYYAVRGSIKLWTGESRGWADLLAFFAIEAASVATHICYLDEAIAKRGGKYIDRKMGVAQLHWIGMNRATLMLITAAAFDRSEFGRWLGNRLKESVLRNDLLVSYPWTQATFERSWIKVFDVEQGRSVSAIDESFGRECSFQPLLNAWSDDEAFGGALSQCCDYHLENCRKDSHVFATLPFPFFPAEIVALVKMRRGFGIPTKVPSHPLLETPFAQVPNELPTLDAEHLARRVVERCARDYPALASILP